MKWRLVSAGIFVVFFFAPSVQATPAQADVISNAITLPPDSAVLWDPNAMVGQQVKGSFLLSDAAPSDERAEALSYWWWKVEFDALKSTIARFDDHRLNKIRLGEPDNEGWLAPEIITAREERPVIVRNDRARQQQRRLPLLLSGSDNHYFRFHADTRRRGEHGLLLAMADVETQSETETQALHDAAGDESTVNDDASLLQHYPYRQMFDRDLFFELAEAEPRPAKIIEPGSSGLLVLGLMGLLWLRRRRA